MNESDRIAAITPPISTVSRAEHGKEAHNSRGTTWSSAASARSAMSAGAGVDETLGGVLAPPAIASTKADAADEEGRHGTGVHRVHQRHDQAQHGADQHGDVGRNVPQSTGWP